MAPSTPPNAPPAQSEASAPADVPARPPRDRIPALLPNDVRAFVEVAPDRVVYAVVFSRLALFLPNPTPEEEARANAVGFVRAPHRCGMLMFPTLAGYA